MSAMAWAAAIEVRTGWAGGPVGGGVNSLGNGSHKFLAALHRIVLSRYEVAAPTVHHRHRDRSSSETSRLGFHRRTAHQETKTPRRVPLLTRRGSNARPPGGRSKSTRSLPTDPSLRNSFTLAHPTGGRHPSGNGRDPSGVAGTSRRRTGKRRGRKTQRPRL